MQITMIDGKIQSLVDKISNSIIKDVNDNWDYKTIIDTVTLGNANGIIMGYYDIYVKNKSDFTIYYAYLKINDLLIHNIDDFLNVLFVKVVDRYMDKYNIVLTIKDIQDIVSILKAKTKNKICDILSKKYVSDAFGVSDISTDYIDMMSERIVDGIKTYVLN